MFFKRALVYLLDTILVLILVLLAYFAVFSIVTANPQQVKKIINESGVYQKITPVVFDKYAQTEAEKEQGSNPQVLPLQNEAVRNAAVSAFSPEFVKQNLEQGVDGIYLWLDGQTPQPSFEINIAEAKNQFVAQVADSAATRAETLPTCTIQQLRELEQTDLLSISCLPPGADIAALKAEFIDSVNKNGDFLQQTIISPETLGDDGNRNIFEDYKRAPENFQATKQLPYILAFLAIMVGVGIVFLNNSRREGLGKLGKFLALSGVFVILIPLGISTIIDNLLQGASSNAILSELVVPLINQFLDTASKIYYIIGAIYLIIAAVVFLVYRRLRPAEPAQKEEA